MQNHLALIISPILLLIISGCLSTTNNSDSSDKSEQIIHTAFAVGLSNIDITQITNYDAMIDQINKYLGISTEYVQVQSIFLIDNFTSSTNTNEMKQYTGVDLSCDIVLDKIIVKSQKCGLLTIKLHIQKFPSSVCKTESCKETYTAHIKRSIEMCFSFALRVTLQIANGDYRLVPIQFCYFLNSSTTTTTISITREPATSTIPTTAVPYNSANKCLCTIDLNGTNSTNGTEHFLITFGYGFDQYSNKTPADFGFTTGHIQMFSGTPSDGYFVIANALPETFYWLVVKKDHAADENGGYMYVVNALTYPGLYFNKTIDNLTVGKIYEFSMYAANLNKPERSVLPNILFEVRTVTPDNNLITQRNSSDIPEYANITWSKNEISFVAPSTSVMLLIISNCHSNARNDLVIDDIGLCEC
ncbi:unnamed protein product [Adineta ricciae]|uniref:Fibronectin type-III domain-containing protein n=1 Tax=Adineta ricciae TaxID=249248 RepID=A0A814Q9Z3_ADIRI|nr:unnamed protein product [Adineta ricciae]